MAELPEQTQAQLPAEHPIAIYNAFPRDFANMQQLMDYLPRIAEMRCDVVWINPIQECTANRFYERTSKLTGQQIHVKDSVYAMTRDDRFLPGWEGNVAALTDVANGLGMDMMFDLVLNHVSTDAEMTRRPENRDWFNGNHAKLRGAVKAADNKFTFSQII